ncbi:hypothetical protein K438DRAFT_1884209 [Mycena galopus ATCC 62051]|nr:hypothetical protein K438DRAFT_1884209 [Mycena galopus ATCC 62051]
MSDTTEYDSAAEAEYIASWTRTDQRFATYWTHEATTPLLELILDFDNVAAKWPDSKADAVVAINNAFPLLEVLKAKFPEDIATKVNTTLLDVWYGYTRLLALIGVGPKVWAGVQVYETYEPGKVPAGFHFPRIEPIQTRGPMISCTDTDLFNMPHDVLKRTAKPAKRGSKSAPSTPSNKPEPSTQPEPKAPSGSSTKKPALKRSAPPDDDEDDEDKVEPSPSKRLRFAGVSVPTASSAATSSKPSTRSQDKVPTSGTSQTGPVPKPAFKGAAASKRKTPATAPSKVAEPEVPKVPVQEVQVIESDDDEGGSQDADGEDEVEPEEDAEEEDVKPATRRPARGATKPAAAGPSKAKGKKTTLAAIDPAALGKAVETLLRKRQNNRKATSGDEFNISTDDQKHIISTVRLGASSNPVFYTGLPASDPTKPAKLGPNPLEDRRLSLSDTKAITDGLNEFIPHAPCLNCIILGKECTPTAFGTLCDNCASSTMHGCTYNRDAAQVVEFIRRLGEWTSLSPEYLRSENDELVELIQTADRARRLADVAALRAAQRLSNFATNALLVVDKFGPEPFKACFNDETPEAIQNFVNSLIDSYNERFQGGGTFDTNEWVSKIPASRLVEFDALTRLGASTFTFGDAVPQTTPQTKTKSKGKSKA